jgi:hypothetical protein
MKPIGQTFFISEPPPPTGSAGVFITRIDVFFQNIDPNTGIEMQIRTTENGQPTQNRLPFGKKVIQSTDTIDAPLTIGGASVTRNVILASEDATVYTPFIFDTPVFVQSGTEYAFVLAPLGGSPNYNVWTAEVGQTDVTSGVPIYTNNGTGDLFLSSNDIAWEPIINEDIKFIIYTANFTTQSGNAYFTTPDEDWIIYKDTVGTFLTREPVVFSNGYYNYSVLGISGTQGTFSVGDTVYQANATANVSGIVYAVNSSVISISNANGVFSNTVAGSPLLYDANTSANASVISVSQNVATTATSNVISVPDSSVFATNQVIFLQTSNRSTSQIATVTGIVNPTTIALANNVTFTETNALYGRVKADGTLKAHYSGSVVYNNWNYGVLDAVTANSTVNLSGVSNVQMIGVYTGSSANVIGIHDPIYNSLTTNFTSIAAPNTYLNWSFEGFASDTNRTPDNAYITITDGIANEFIDTERVAMSRSNELAALPTPRLGNNSVVIQVGMSSDNTNISPSIDTIQTNVTYTYNIVPVVNDLNGAYLSISPNMGPFTNGDIVSQTSYGNTTTGIIAYANNTYLRVTNVNGKFISNTAFTTSASATGFINTAENYSEANTNGFYKVSRYISKNVILAAGQDSEDIRAYLGAFRPANTNLYVYAKIQSSLDNEQYNAKSWTKLNEISPTSLLSSKVNINDRVELVYGFNQSQNIFLSNTITSSSSNTITLQSTAGLSNNMIVYMQDNISSKPFNVREIVYVVNSTAVVVDRPPSFSSTNASFGIIPGIESTTSAFLYDQNSNIIRYVTSSDAVYDNFIQFAMKIVPIADSTALVPRVGDLRVLALQV